ncbi:uncharacterized protein J8A68_003604 [[Candida] subhashii]|uniref:Ribosome maturation protein SDO1/SBDS N-terminal domain-containing protein n=1 Tax=[Candida] subhashii TaxID=561895 RepID=A0A8J5Q8D1_9ASCO|nr:uncharacterized protein J8A68_003604 [[Candida] subhashii]KAG7662834.1 hypothetical protein J8A68_003604 [[Candida] subhashii]
MARTPHKLFHKGTSTDFVVFVESPELLKQYRKDKSIGLMDVVSIPKVFASRAHGADGMFDEASKSELANEFGTSRVDDVLDKILIEGNDKATAFISGDYSSKNDSKGSGARGFF